MAGRGASGRGGAVERGRAGRTRHCRARLSCDCPGRGAWQRRNPQRTGALRFRGALVRTRHHTRRVLGPARADRTGERRARLARRPPARCRRHRRCRGGLQPHAAGTHGHAMAGRARQPETGRAALRMAVDQFRSRAQPRRAGPVAPVAAGTRASEADAVHCAACENCRAGERAGLRPCAARRARRRRPAGRLHAVGRCPRGAGGGAGPPRYIRHPGGGRRPDASPARAGSRFPVNEG
ncbi:hypothetical protein D3C72_1270180 [compost metagenome]